MSRSGPRYSLSQSRWVRGAVTERTRGLTSTSAKGVERWKRFLLRFGKTRPVHRFPGSFLGVSTFLRKSPQGQDKPEGYFAGGQSNGRSFSPVGQMFWRELSPMHGLNTSVPPMGHKAPKPPEGVSFGELASVRKTPRTSQQSAQNSSAEAWRLPDEKWVKEPPPTWACSQSVASGTAGRTEVRDPLCQDSRGTVTVAERDDTL